MKIGQARAVVTGGAAGLGYAVAECVLQAGGKVCILDCDVNAGRAAAAAFGPQAKFIACDVGSENEVDAAMRAAADAMGGIDLLVNCAGILGAARVLGREGPMSGDLFARVVQVNLLGTFLCDKAAAGIMQRNAPGEDGERGLLVHTSSVAAFEGQIGQAAYAATKAAVAGMTLPIARELAAFGIRCVSIAPGSFDTPMLAALSEAQRAALAQQVPFPQRLGRPGEFARLVVAAFEIAMLNGATIRLDGALRMQPK
jgi:NAD(P)-dependent dehydrogenase (short-subunit alcohol dehydrogenase family)